MTIRLNKVTRDLNVGIATVVEFLQKKGYTIEANPNTKITEEQYAVLVKEFSTDKNLKKESEKFIQDRKNKERNNPTVSIEKAEEPKKEEPKAEESDLPKIDYLKDLEQRMQAQLGRKVKIAGKGKKKTIQLTYEDNEDLEELLRLLCGEDFLNRV